MIGSKQIYAGIMCLFAASVAVSAEPVAPEDVKFVDGAVEASVSGEAGDAASGRKIFASRGLGNCVACHILSDQSDQSFPGNVGPPLDGVADRWSEAEIRGIVVNAKELFTEETIMPGFYSLDVGENVRKDLIGKTILTAQQVEDVVAYLMTIKE